MGKRQHSRRANRVACAAVGESAALTPSPVLNIEAAPPADQGQAPALRVDGSRPTALEERLDAETQGRVGAAAGLQALGREHGSSEESVAERNATHEESGSQPALVRRGSQHGSELSRKQDAGRLQWRGMDVCDEFRAYAARVAAGADLPPYRGPILKDPGFPWHRQLNPVSTEREPSGRGVALVVVLCAVALGVSGLLASENASTLAGEQTSVGALQAATTKVAVPDPRAPEDSPLPPLSLPNEAAQPSRPDQAIGHGSEPPAQPASRGPEATPAPESTPPRAPAPANAPQPKRLSNPLPSPSSLAASAKAEVSAPSRGPLAGDRAPQPPSQPMEAQLPPPPPPPSVRAKPQPSPGGEANPALAEFTHPELAPPPPWVQPEPEPPANQAPLPAPNAGKKAPSLLVEEPSF